MAKIEMDTEKVLKAGYAIKDLAKEYNDLIDDMFTKIQNLSNSGIWLGANANSAANKFISNTMNDKSSFSNFGVSINNLGVVAINDANSVKNVADTSI